MTESSTLASPWERDHSSILRNLALILVFVGLAWRIGRYLLAFPIWGDEAFLLLNYHDRSFADLFGPIDNCQIAPLLFHLLEMAVFKWLGPGEWSVRLPPLLACLGSIVLFWRLARLLLPPLAHCLAVAVFSVAIWPATMGSLVKPYAFDLFFSLTLVLPAACWLERPDRLRSLLVLAGVAPIAMLGSYPCAFVGGALALVLAPIAWHRGDRRALATLALFAVLLAGTFAAHYLFVARRHLSSPVNGVTTAIGMDLYWADGFPPANPLRFLSWFFLIHTGQMAAYPLGSASGGSALSAGLALLGMFWLWLNQRRWMVLLMLATCGLWLAASLLRKYPYGISCRLSQHVAPFYCLGVGLGASVLLGRIVSDARRWRTTLGLMGLLAVVGVSGLVRDCLWPYREDRARRSRQVARTLHRKSGNDPIVVLLGKPHLEASLHYYLRLAGARIQWAETLDWKATAQKNESVWVFNAGLPMNESGGVEKALSQQAGPWRCVERDRFHLGISNAGDPIYHCHILHCVRGDQVTAHPGSGE